MMLDNPLGWKRYRANDVLSRRFTVGVSLGKSSLLCLLMYESPVEIARMSLLSFDGMERMKIPPL
jgi:hypothetical protein